MTTILTGSEVRDWVKRLLEYRAHEQNRLELLHAYIKDPLPDAPYWSINQPNGPLRWLKSDVPNEVRRLAEMSRVNMLKFVVNSTAQVLYVDGFRAPSSLDEEPSWETWQVNRLDARQTAVHRDAMSYGAGYAVVLPGEPKTVIRGASPRRLTAVYGDDDEWPELAVEIRRSAKKGVKLYRLYDANATWWVEVNDRDEATIVDEEEHGVGHVPIVRFVPEQDTEGESAGDIEGLIALQDQINVTTFELLVSQHFGAFRQRYIMGWAATTEEEALKASARRIWNFEDPDVKVGEFAQTDLSGYINSREASLRHLATISQTPAHELLGQLVNLSADALAAAERNHRNKVLERQMSFGESWEQVLELAARLDGEASDPMAYVRWKDTEARSMSQMADALGKLVQMLGVPAEELWERVPGVTQQEIERWKATAERNKATDPMAQMATTLQQQAAGASADE